MVGNFTRQIRYEDTWIATAVDPRTSETRMYAFEYDTGVGQIAARSWCLATARRAFRSSSAIQRRTPKFRSPM